MTSLPRSSFCRAALLLAVLLLGGCAARGRALDPRSPTFPPLQFKAPSTGRALLSGGAPVFLLPDRDVPLVRLFLAFRGGSVHDPQEKAGLAQVAGLAWRTGGTRTSASERFDEEVEKRGIELNLGFGRDKGWATLSVLPRDLPEGLDLLAELIFDPVFQESRVAWAAAQVEEGIRREADDPDTLAYRELRRALYRGHPRGVIASRDSVRQVTREDVISLHRRLVTEGSWVLGVTGDFDSDRLLPELESRFGRLSTGRAFPPPPRPSDPAPALVLVPRPLAQSTILWARIAPERLSSGFYPLELADHILGGGGFQSRLVKEIRSDRGLAYSVGSFYDAYVEFGVLGVHAATKPDATAEVVRLVERIVGQAAVEGFSAAEVAKAREALQNRHVFRYEDPASLVREEMSLSLDGLPLDLPATYVDRISAVAPSQVAEVAAANLRIGSGVVVIVGDVDPKDPAWAQGRHLRLVP